GENTAARRLADSGVLVLKSRPHCLQRWFGPDASEGPDRLHTGLPFAFGQDLDQLSDRLTALSRKGLHRAIANHRPIIVQTRCQLLRGGGFPLEIETSGILWAGDAFLADTINRSKHIRLGNTGTRAPDSKPSAGIDNQEAAVCILDNISEMSVGTGR